MKAIFALLRRLNMVSMACLAIVATPIAAQAAERDHAYATTAAKLVLPTAGIAMEYAALTLSESRVEPILIDEEGNPIASRTLWDDGTDDGEDAGSGPTESCFAEVFPDGPLSSESDGFAPSRTPIASYGPFHLVTADTVEMIGTIDSSTPCQFAALLAAHPGIRRLVMLECPGSEDETATHMLGRAVRRAGIATHVPNGGSVRSGAVDLFLAGVERTAARRAEFVVHSWRDEDGYEARDFPANDPVHAEYISYYREMGLSDAVARQFYAVTISVGFDDVRTLSAADMARLGLARVSG